MPSPEPTEISANGKEAIAQFMDWLGQTKHWQRLLGYEDFYYCSDPQADNYLAPLRQKLGIPAGKGIVYKIEGQKKLPLKCTLGPAYVYPLYVEPGANPKIGMNAQSLEHSISVGLVWKITELSYIGPPLVFLSTTELAKSTS